MRSLKKQESLTSNIIANPIRTGLIIAPQKVSDYHFGGISGAYSSPINTSGQWDEYLPTKEYQWGYKTDTQGCVSFSALNIIETLEKYQTGKELNYSDRALAKLSGTTINGNYLYRVADTIRNVGLIGEQIWGWDRSSFDFDTFYQEVPQDIVKTANKWLEAHATSYEWVTPIPERLMEALKYAPLQITISYAGGDGIIQKNSGPENHAVVLYGYEEGQFWKIYDTYEKVNKKFAWDYTIFSALKYTLKSEKPMTDLYNNTLYQLIEGAGGFGLSVGEKFYVDDLDKILASWAVRNNGDIRGKVGILKKAEWDVIPKWNLKNEKL